MLTDLSNIEFINDYVEDESEILKHVDKNASENVLSFEQIALEMGFDPKNDLEQRAPKGQTSLSVSNGQLQFSSRNGR